MLQNQSFTDPQGQSYTDAVIKVRFAQFDRNWGGNESSTLTTDNQNPTAPATVNENTGFSNDTSNIQVEFVYWPTQASFDNGFRPYTLMNYSNGNFSYQFSIEDEVLDKDRYKALGLEEKCETYLLERILPNL